MKEAECVIGAGSVGSHGYKRITRSRVTELAHRQVWIDANGPIPSGHVVHHICGERTCINLAHLQLLTQAEHARLHHPPQAFCKRGHPRTAENVKRNGACRLCARVYLREWRQRRREQLARG